MMSDNSKIEWTDASWNPLRVTNKATGTTGHYCAHVSEGCRNCYAERMQPRFHNPIRYAAQDLRKVTPFLDETTLRMPLKWRKPRRVFVCSMTDLFGAWVTDTQIDRIFAIMALCPQHTFQILTKRPERMRQYMDPFCRRRAEGLGTVVLSLGYSGPLEALRWPMPNVWLGVSVEDQAAADARIPALLDTPSEVRFISAEPLLGHVNLESVRGGTQWIGGQRGCQGTHNGIGTTECPRERHHHHDERCRDGLDWVITGGESGPYARPMQADWARALRDQCHAAGVPFHFKQWGDWLPAGQMMADGKLYSPGCETSLHAIRKMTGRYLDGTIHDASPDRVVTLLEKT